MLQLVYVFDIIVTNNEYTFRHAFIRRTNEESSIKDLGHMSYFLGLKIAHTINHLFLGQAKYVRDILDHAHMLTSIPVATQWEVSAQLHSA